MISSLQKQEEKQVRQNEEVPDFTEHVDFEEDEGDWEMEVEKLPLGSVETTSLVAGNEGKKEKGKEEK